ncbi:hypothetical protein [Mesorhizobium sp. M0767]|uniref:hypothetical protein n=1 Tax=Mesorhizobium sp. M0767 TaxID=2956995 RepID=UPI003336848F
MDGVVEPRIADGEYEFSRIKELDAESLGTLGSGHVSGDRSLVFLLALAKLAVDALAVPLNHEEVVCHRLCPLASSACDTWHARTVSDRSWRAQSST